MRYWSFVRGIHRSPVNSHHKGQWRGALMFSLICAWINGWVNNCETGNLRRHCAHYDVTVMYIKMFCNFYFKLMTSKWYKFNNQWIKLATDRDRTCLFRWEISCYSPPRVFHERNIISLCDLTLLMGAIFLSIHFSIFAIKSANTEKCVDNNLRKEKIIQTHQNR